MDSLRISFHDKLVNCPSIMCSLLSQTIFSQMSFKHHYHQSLVWQLYWSEIGRIFPVNLK